MTPNKIIAKKGRKSIIVKTQNQEKCRVSLLLTIIADGGKFLSYKISKSKQNGKIENLLKKDANVIYKKY